MLFLFENFSLDDERRELRRAGASVDVEPKVFDLLAHVVRNRDRVISRDELIAEIWGGRIVSESALATCINAARTSISDNGGEQRLIKTLPRKGIRFIGAVREDNGNDEPSVKTPLLPPPHFSLPDRPSIAVLPFRNIGNDPEQQYFSDGVVEDIITGLSRVRWLFVIARNSSFIFKSTPDVQQVARELGVRYVLEGSVRRAGNRVRVSAQLIEAEGGTNLWAERYDRLMDDIFSLQDDLTMSVVGAIEPSLRKAEIARVRRKRTESLDAYDLVLRAAPYAHSHIAEDALVAIPMLERALELDPGYVTAHALLAWCFHFRFSRAGLNESDRAAAIQHARAAISTGSDDATALGMSGFVISLDEHDHITAVNVFDRALALSNSNIFALSCSAHVSAWMGKFEDAIDRAQRAVRLSPFDQLNFLSYNTLAISYFCLLRFQDAHDAALRSVQINPRFSVCHLFLSAALLRLGQNEAARLEAKQVLALDPTFTIRRFSVTVGFEPKVFTPLAEAWRSAGLPEG